MARDAVSIDSERAATLLVAIQAGDAIACAIPLGIIQRDLERLGCSPALQRTIPAVKGASAAGLVAGRRTPRLGRLTCDALVAYFLCALGAHARMRDPLWRWVPAAGMLGLALFARRAFSEPDFVDLVPQDEIDLTAREARNTDEVDAASQPADLSA